MAECEAYLSGKSDGLGKQKKKVNTIAIPLARGSCFECVEVICQHL
jgi:hypothetical protein